MAKATRFTNLEVTGDLTVKGNTANKGITKATYQTDSTKTLPTSMSASYTQDEQAKILAALGDLRSKYNLLVTKLADGTDPT